MSYQKPVSSNQKRAFTLIEIMLVVIIIGILAAMAIPRLTGRSEQARTAVARADIDANIALALDSYEMDMGRYPDKLDDLFTKPADADNWRGPYIKKKPRDPWGREYKYTLGADGKEYTLCSDGPSDAKSEDDICNTDEGI